MEIQWNKGAWKYLVFDREKKSQLEDLLKQHKKSMIRWEEKKRSNESKSSNTTTNFDMIANKGKGLLFVLKGPPGVGKTTTVEALSELMGQPLVRMETRMISAMSKEHEVQDIFENCERWKAILLLDEAEMLLSHRDTGKQTTSYGSHNATVAGMILPFGTNCKPS